MAKANAKAEKRRENIRNATVKVNKTIQKVNDFNDKVADKINNSKAMKGLNNVIKKVSNASSIAKAYIKGNDAMRKAIKNQVLSNHKVLAKIDSVYTGAKTKVKSKYNNVSTAISDAFHAAGEKFGSMMSSGKNLYTSVKSSGKEYMSKIFDNVEESYKNVLRKAGADGVARNFVDNVIENMYNNVLINEANEEANKINAINKSLDNYNRDRPGGRDQATIDDLNKRKKEAQSRLNDIKSELSKYDLSQKYGQKK